MVSQIINGLRIRNTDCNINQWKCRSGCLFEILASTYGPAPGPHGQGPLIILEEYPKSDMLQEHYLNAHCSRSIFATCFWSSVHFKYDPGVYLT